MRHTVVTAVYVSISSPPHPRCNIPVVVMGETGCGKTRLIRFMCDMIALSAGGGIDCVRNMLIMKVPVQLARSLYIVGVTCPTHTGSLWDDREGCNKEGGGG